MIKYIVLLLLITIVNAQNVCLPESNCFAQQPLCRSCLPGDSTCFEPQTIVSGFCGPYKDYSEDKELTRQQRYLACKEAAIARALPSLRDSLRKLDNRYFYKNCIKGEHMCRDNSCQLDEVNCSKRGGVLFYATGEESCSSTALPLSSFWESNAILTLGAVSEEVDPTKDVPTKPADLSTGELVKFCTYFYEVVMLGGSKQSKATDAYVTFLYSCFDDYKDFLSNALVQTMNEFNTLSGQRAIRNLDIFDARNYPGVAALA